MYWNQRRPLYVDCPFMYDYVREEGEILNVYLAWLNLENTFGNQESLQKVRENQGAPSTLS